MKILVVDDFITNVSFLRITLTKLGHAVVTVRDGAEAVEVLKSEAMDVVVTDWMMPNLDGLGLIHWIRATSGQNPAIVVITALASADAEAKALSAGADVFLTKPILPATIASVISEIESRRSVRRAPKPASEAGARPTLPKYCAVAFGAGTGGAQGVRTIFRTMGKIPAAAFFIVLHGPGWAAEALAEQMRTHLPDATVVIPRNGEAVVPGSIYIAPGDRHMMLSSSGTTIELTQDAPENFHRPSIDPLFRSLANVFGRGALGVILTGTGIDGYIGAGHIQVAHGTIIVQEPTAAALSQMSQNVITLGLATHILPLERISGVLLAQIAKFHEGRSAVSFTNASGSLQ